MIKLYSEIFGGKYEKIFVSTNFVYFYKDLMIESDPKTFKVFNYDYSKDKNNVYFR